MLFNRKEWASNHLSSTHHTPLARRVGPLCPRRVPSCWVCGRLLDFCPAWAWCSMSDDPFPPVVVSQNPSFMYRLNGVNSLALGNLRHRVFTSTILFEIIWFCT
jgi:hypothetical protein